MHYDVIPGVSRNAGMRETAGVTPPPSLIALEAEWVQTSSRIQRLLARLFGCRSPQQFADWEQREPELRQDVECLLQQKRCRLQQLVAASVQRHRAKENYVPIRSPPAERLSLSGNETFPLASLLYKSKILPRHRSPKSPRESVRRPTRPQLERAIYLAPPRSAGDDLFELSAGHSSSAAECFSFTTTLVASRSSDSPPRPIRMLHSHWSSESSMTETPSLKRLSEEAPASPAEIQELFTSGVPLHQDSRLEDSHSSSQTLFGASTPESSVGHSECNPSAAGVFLPRVSEDASNEDNFHSSEPFLAEIGDIDPNNSGSIKGHWNRHKSLSLETAAEDLKSAQTTLQHENFRKELREAIEKRVKENRTKEAEEVVENRISEAICDTAECPELSSDRESETSAAAETAVSAETAVEDTASIEMAAAKSPLPPAILEDLTRGSAKVQAILRYSSVNQQRHSLPEATISSPCTGPPTLPANQPTPTALPPCNLPTLAGDLPTPLVSMPRPPVHLSSVGISASPNDLQSQSLGLRSVSGGSTTPVQYSRTASGAANPWRALWRAPLIRIAPRSPPPSPSQQKTPGPWRPSRIASPRSNPALPWTPIEVDSAPQFPGRRCLSQSSVSPTRTSPSRVGPRHLQKSPQNPLSAWLQNPFEAMQGMYECMHSKGRKQRGKA
eukprot:Gregarina_sp_Poly_1__6550@NODE_350_length_9319_cov_183_335387_g293_i0_p2_GENE_NODE_350_length_9319_cov_183_335387_g293_i0NODE_350_length_9319_cov_183_335387_g293_i0_p2_ORF_typecomplete_len672_score108_53VitDbind_III/PF09164_10/0_52PAX/PF00292_18/0_92_NODE_350_length_9319_cov_183_335387_g293_i016213636